MSVETVKRQHGTALERDIVPFGFGFAAYVEADTVSRRRMVRAARRTWREFRQDFGYAGGAALLTPPTAQPKTGKNAVKTWTLMLKPSVSVFGNACPAATDGCSTACLDSAGHGQFSDVQYARTVRMAFLVAWPFEFGVIVAAELVAHVARDGRIGFRPNCVSDIRWEIVAPGMLAWCAANGVTVYDYTAWKPSLRAVPASYRLTFSAKETHSVEDIRALVESGHNVAVPFAVRKGEPLPSAWHGMRVIDGDVTDFRPDDPHGVIVGLRAKGDAIGDTSGFVRSA